MVSKANAARNDGPVAHPVEEGTSLTGERHDLPSLPRAVEPSYLAPRWESDRLPAKVSNTITEARVLSTRWLYGQK